MRRDSKTNKKAYKNMHKQSQKKKKNQAQKE